MAQTFELIYIFGVMTGLIIVCFVVTHLGTISQARHDDMIREEERYAALERKIAIAEEGSRARQRGERWTPPPDWNDSID